jgi:hypothetical protein
VRQYIREERPDGAKLLTSWQVRRGEKEERMGQNASFKGMSPGDLVLPTGPYHPVSSTS